MKEGEGKEDAIDREKERKTQVATGREQEEEGEAAGREWLLLFSTFYFVLGYSLLKNSTVLGKH